MSDEAQGYIFDPTTVFENYDLTQTSQGVAGERCAQSMEKAHIDNVLDFACLVLSFVDSEHDGQRWNVAACEALCTALPSWEAKSRIKQCIGNCKTRLPEYLTNWLATSRFVLIYDGWMMNMSFSRNLRFTIVGDTGDRFIAFHSRETV